MYMYMYRKAIESLKPARQPGDAKHQGILYMFIYLYVYVYIYT